MNQDLTRQYVSNMLEDQVTGQHKRKEMLIRRPRGKAVMSGPGARKDTKERSLRNREREQDLVNIFQEGIISYFFTFGRAGVQPKGGIFKLI